MKQEKSSIKGRTTGDKRTEIIIKDIERRIINKEMFSLAGFEVTNMKFIKRYLNCRNDRENALYVAGMLEEYFNGFEIFLVSEDEIVVLMSGVDSKAAYERSLKFLDILSEPVLLCGIPVNVDITCGIVEYQQGSGTAEKLYGRLSKAILAAYDNKERICIYSEEMSGLLRKQLYNRVRMYNAILMNKLKLEYQPKFSLAKNRITGAEALIRWEESGMDAAEIIEAAENADMMTHLTKWVARESIKQVGRWKKEGIDTTISINVTKLDLMDSSLLEYMVSCLEDCKVDAGRIDLEIKDSCIYENGEDIMNALKKFRNHGFGIAVDSYDGSRGESNDMEDLPVYKVKIEKAMIRDIENGMRLSKVENLIRRAKESRINVVAEGIETETQYMILQYLGCDMMQGFYISRPLTPEKFVETLKRNYTVLPQLSQTYSEYVV